MGEHRIEVSRGSRSASPGRMHDENLNPRELLFAGFVSIAAETARQSVWPSTRKERRLEWHPAYWTLPATSGDIRFRDADDEELAKAGIENQFGRHPRIAAAQDGRVGMLAFCEIGEDFLCAVGIFRCRRRIVRSRLLGAAVLHLRRGWIRCSNSFQQRSALISRRSKVDFIMTPARRL